jgi:hypothetical protein
MSDWYDRNGQPLTSKQADDLLQDLEYKRLASSTVTSTEDPELDLLVSTVWLGLDHNWRVMPGPPLIFETMVFSKTGDHPLEDYQERYSTEAEALEGHRHVLDHVTSHVGPSAVVSEGQTEENGMSRHERLVKAAKLLGLGRVSRGTEGKNEQ